MERVIPLTKERIINFLNVLILVIMERVIPPKPWKDKKIPSLNPGHNGKGDSTFRRAKFEP